MGPRVRACCGGRARRTFARSARSGNRAYGLAETCLERASRAGGEIGDEANRLLGRFLWITGRPDEYRQQLRRNASRADDPSETLRQLWSIDHDAYPIDGMSLVLKKALATAPEDDRVLARARRPASACRSARRLWRLAHSLRARPPG